MATSELLKLQETLQKSTAYLEQRGIEPARRECEWIFCEILGLSRMDLYTRFDMPLSAEQAATLRSLIQRRGRREPLAYVLGNQDFCDLKLTVTPDVLVPRPETEELVARILQEHQAESLRLVDIGTGSGAIALALKQKRPQWQVSATDISAAALAVARRNAQEHKLEIAFCEGDLHTALDGQFDLIVANLPYIAESERELCDPELAFEPQLALFAEDNGLALIRRLVSGFHDYAASGASLWLETGFRQADAVAEIAAAADLQLTVLQDLNGLDRIMHLRAPA